MAGRRGRKKGTPKTGGWRVGSPRKKLLAQIIEEPAIVFTPWESPEQIRRTLPLDAMLWVMRECIALSDLTGTLATASVAAPYITPG